MAAAKTVSECSMMQELVELFGRKVSLIDMCLDFRKLNYNACQCFRVLEKDVEELQMVLCQMREEIKIGEENLRHMKAMSGRISVAHEMIDHAIEHFPSTLEKKAAPTMQKSESVSTNKVNPPMTGSSEQPRPKVVKTIPTIMPLSISEFQKVPKYMRGRNTYETINSFIGDFNKTIAAKYHYLATPRGQLGSSGYKAVQEMKAQETAETKGLHFCVAQDFKRFAGIQSENNIKAMLTILRHCSRTKEIRGPGPVVRFVALDHGK